MEITYWKPEPEMMRFNDDFQVPGIYRLPLFYNGGSSRRVGGRNDKLISFIQFPEVISSQKTGNLDRLYEKENPYSGLTFLQLSSYPSLFRRTD